MSARFVTSARLLVAGAIVVATASAALAQALPNLNSLRVRYNTQKTTAKPDGELKASIDQVDKEIAEATRLGRTGEMRRLYAKGLTLLAGRPWTDVEEFQSSLVLRGAVVVDSSQPQIVRLEQIFPPSIALSRPLTAVASLRPAPAPQAGGGAPAAPPAARVQVGTFEGVSRDLRESPLAMELNLQSVADGAHVLEVDVREGERALGSVTLRLSLQKNLENRLRQLETAATSAHADVRADLRYPADYIRKVNRGLVELGAFNVGAEMSAAETLAVSAKGGKNPFTGRKGDFERHYLLEPAGEIMPYRVYVPASYDGSRAYPLVVALHGLGANEDSFMDGYGRNVPTEAEKRGYIVVSPLGYRVDGFYGYALSTDADPAGRRRVELSEQDVMEVLRRTRAEYKIDSARIYLMGHSMGAIGTWAIGAKHADIWAALAPFSGLGNPATAERMRHIPQIVVHGDADPTVSVNGSRSMVEALKKVGAEVNYIEVPGGNHINVVAPNIAAVFDFFDKHVKKPATTSAGR